jgi:hypothetical protein
MSHSNTQIYIKYPRLILIIIYCCDSGELMQVYDRVGYLSIQIEHGRHPQAVLNLHFRTVYNVTDQYLERYFVR